jgi:hypothetical protein
VSWLRALAATAYRECGGPGVGAIGMCLTGGFALAMAVDPAVLAPVVSQPGLPAPLTAAKRAAVGLDATDLAQVKARTHAGLCVLGLRFSADRGCPAERFQTLRRELGRRLRGDRGRLLTRQSSRHPHPGACGIDRRPGRRARPSHPGRPGPRPGVPRPAPAPMIATPASATIQEVGERQSTGSPCPLPGMGARHDFRWVSKKATMRRRASWADGS